MTYNKLVSISGMSGLFELMTSKADGGIVRSLEDKSTKFVSNRVHHFSHLESIEIYTVKDNVNLVDVFEAMSAGKEPLPENNADNASLKSYFEKVFPDMDFERVYSSDMKKMVRWFKTLNENKVEIKLSDVPADADADATVEKTVAPKTVAQPKAAAVKNAPAKKINSPRKMA